MKKLFILAVAFFLQAAVFSQTTVYLIPALHSMHKTNFRYNYDSVQATIQRLQPDVIAVEIRTEDINADTAYLKQNYPYEMWMMRHWFPSTSIEGFDWLGKELEGKPIPARYWQDHSRIKALQKLLSLDTTYSKKLASCKIYTDERLVLMNNSTLKGLLQSNDAILIKEYYNCLTQQLRGSEYEELTAFYDERNQQMMQRLKAILDRHTGKRIVVLTGDDHVPYLRAFLAKQGVVLKQPY
jgi:pheromone shutdown protein TraB